MNPYETILASNGQLPSVGPQQAAMNQAMAAYQNPLGQYGLTDAHLGPPNANGFRPINQAGHQALSNLANNNGIPENSSVLGVASNGAAMNMMSQAGVDIPELRKGLVGRAIDNVKQSYLNKQTAPLNDSINKSVNSMFQSQTSAPKISQTGSTNPLDTNYNPLIFQGYAQ